MAEWLRRWTRNPLGSARAGSNPADCALLFFFQTATVDSHQEISTTSKISKTDGTAVVAEWLRRWTRNPLGSARTGSNPVGSE